MCVYIYIYIYTKGVAINFVKNDDIRILRDIEQFYSTQANAAHKGT